MIVRSLDESCGRVSDVSDASDVSGRSDAVAACDGRGMGNGSSG